MKIKIFIPTCDKYMHCIPIIKYTIDKYWSTDLDITVLGYSQPDFDLGNWKFDSLGIDQGSEYFCTQLSDYFSKITDDHFIYLNEDWPIIRPINIELLDIFIDYLKVDKDICKIGLTRDIQNKWVWGKKGEPGHVSYKEEGRYKLIQLKEDARIRNGLAAAIWNRKYFLQSFKNMDDFCVSNGLWWYEGVGDKEFFEQTYVCPTFHYKSTIPDERKLDLIKCKILGSKDNHVLQASHLYSNGKFRNDWFVDGFGSDIMMTEDKKTILRIINNKYDLNNQDNRPLGKN